VPIRNRSAVRHDTPRRCVDSVTVVVPTRNRSRLLASTLRSVLRQRSVDVRVVVVDDASTDDTHAAVARLADGRVRLVRHDHALGVSAARNDGIAQADTEWVAFLDDDDLWAPDKLARQLACASDTTRDWVYAGSVAILPSRVISGAGPPPSAEVACRDLRLRNVIPGGASNVLVRHSALARVGTFDTSLRHMSDWDLWIRLATVGPPGVVDAPLVAYRLHGGNASIDTADIAREMSVIEQRYSRLRNGAPVDRAYVYRWIAWSALRAGRRREALTAYGHAARAGDLASIGRALVALAQPSLLMWRMRRASDRSYERQASRWLAPLLSS
jgi:glycosyltransferase involved in cell wall biosynthesis